MYTHASSMVQVVQKLQSALGSLQGTLLSLKLFLNAQKTKYMIFLKSRSQKVEDVSIFTSDGKSIEERLHINIWVYG